MESIKDLDRALDRVHAQRGHEVGVLIAQNTKLRAEKAELLAAIKSLAASDSWEGDVLSTNHLFDLLAKHEVTK